MTTVLLALGATAAAGALTWFFCMRPMLRSRRAGAAGTDTPAPACCAQPAAGIEDEIRSAREELARLRAAQPRTAPGPCRSRRPPAPAPGAPEATR